MNDYTVVVTYMDGHYEMFSDDSGNGWASPNEALQAYFKLYPGKQDEVLHIEIVHASNEMKIYNKCEELGKELKDLRNYDEVLAAELFPEEYGQKDEVIVATPRPNLTLLHGGKNKVKR